jgi:hypothetical protein
MTIRRLLEPLCWAMGHRWTEWQIIDQVGDHDERREHYKRCRLCGRYENLLGLVDR